MELLTMRVDCVSTFFACGWNTFPTTVFFAQPRYESLYLVLLYLFKIRIQGMKAEETVSGCTCERIN